MSIVDTYRIPAELPDMLELPSDEGLQLKDTPYAMRLASWLHSHEIEVQFLPGSITLGSGPAFNQLDTRLDIPEKMGEAIVTRFGRKVTFGELALNQRHTLDFVGFQRSGNVWVRHIVAYSIRSDDFRQRWDVLVRAT